MSEQTEQDSSNSINTQKVPLLLQIDSLNKIVENIDHSISANDTLHLLLCGGQGSGKSTLIQQVLQAVNLNPRLSNAVIPVQLMEQSYEVLSLADFYLEVLFHLAIALHQSAESQHHDIADLVQSVYEDLRLNLDNEIIERQARTTLWEVSNTTGKRLMLCIENLQDLTRDTDADFTTKLQNLLLGETSIMVLATATSPLVRLSQVDIALVKIFSHIELEPLTAKQYQLLWQQLSPDSHPQTIRPLEILFHGCPKALTILAQRSKGNSNLTLPQKLSYVLDAHEDTFNLQLKSIAPKERKVFLALIDLWTGATTKQITDRARMDMRAVSALLGRLVSKGLVHERSTGKNGKGKIYSPAQPLMCLYYQGKRGESSPELDALLQFMSVYYSHNNWQEQQTLLLNHSAQKVDINESLSCQPWTKEPIAQQLLQWIDINQLEIATGSNIDAYDWMTQFIGPIDDAKNQLQYSALKQCCEQLLKQPAVNQFVLLQAMAHDFIGLSLAATGKWMAAVTVYQHIIDSFYDSPSTTVQLISAQASMNMGLCFEQLNQIEAASQCYSDAISKAGLGTHECIPKVKAQALYLKGRIYLKLDKPASAVNALARVTNEFGEHDDPLLQTQAAKSYLDQGLIWLQMENYSHACKSLIKLIEYMQHSPVTKVCEAVASGHLMLCQAYEAANQPQKVEFTLRQLLALYQDKPVPSDLIAQNLAGAWLQLGMLLIKSSKTEEAMESVKQIFASEKQNNEVIFSALTIVSHIAAHAQYIPTLLAIFEQQPQLKQSCLSMVIALKQELGQSVQTSPEVLAVAQDIRHNIAQTRMVSESAA